MRTCPTHPDRSDRRWILLAALFALASWVSPAAAAPKAPGDIGQYGQCTEVDDPGDAVECCEQAFYMCLESCPADQRAPGTGCGEYCLDQVFYACIQATRGDAAARPRWPRGGSHVGRPTGPSGAISRPEATPGKPKQAPSVPPRRAIEAERRR